MLLHFTPPTYFIFVTHKKSAGYLGRQLFVTFVCSGAPRERDTDKWRVVDGRGNDWYVWPNCEQTDATTFSTAALSLPTKL